MSFDDSYELFIVLFVLIFISSVWAGLIRPFALSVIRTSLYRLRDELRRWFIELPDKGEGLSKSSQHFSYLFMERAINCIAAHPERVTLWSIMYMKVARESSKRGVDALEVEISRFEKERRSKVKWIDKQHTLIFVCLLFMNSPLEVLALVGYLMCSALLTLLKGKSPLTEVNDEVKMIVAASHQQSPHRTAF